MDFVNFRGLTDEDLEAARAAMAEAPPLTAAQIHVISTLMGLTPVDVDVAHREACRVAPLMP
jgi:hypothetical protein